MNEPPRLPWEFEPPVALLTLPGAFLVNGALTPMEPWAKACPCILPAEIRLIGSGAVLMGRMGDELAKWVLQPISC